MVQQVAGEEGPVLTLAVLIKGTDLFVGQCRAGSLLRGPGQPATATRSHAIHPLTSPRRK